MREQQTARAQTVVDAGVEAGSAKIPTTSAKASLFPNSRTDSLPAGEPGENRPQVCAIWAQDARGIIGDGRRMLWRVPADFRHFKETTWGCPVVMGRKSWEALPGALPGRQNFVITRQPDYVAPGATVVGSLEEALQAATAFIFSGNTSDSPVHTLVDASSDTSDTSPGVSSSDSLEAPSDTSRSTSATPRIWIIGGAQVYAQALSLVDELVITYLDLDVRDSAIMSAETVANRPAEPERRLLADVPVKLVKQLDNPADTPAELAELAAAPLIDPALWVPSPAAPEEVPWQEKSGAARWKVVTWRRRTTEQPAQNSQ